MCVMEISIKEKKNTDCVQTVGIIQKQFQYIIRILHYKLLFSLCQVFIVVESGIIRDGLNNLLK